MRSAGTKRPGKPVRRRRRQGAPLSETSTVDTPATLGEQLRRIHPEASGRTRKQMLETGRVRVNGDVVTLPKTPLRPGDVVEVVERRGARLMASPLPSGLRLVHEDDEIIVVEKAAGLLTIATDKERQRTAYAYLRKHVKGADAAASLFIVHRLDRPASGLLVFAKSLDAKRALQAQFRVHSVERIYVAVVEGAMMQEEGTISGRLVEGPSGRVHETLAGGSDAETHFRRIARGKRYSTLEVRLETGRKHQIRVHLAGRGHPVVGDSVYGTGSGPIGRLALHARTLGFEHPGTGERTRFETTVPEVFLKLR